MAWIPYTDQLRHPEAERLKLEFMDSRLAGLVSPRKSEADFQSDETYKESELGNLSDSSAPRPARREKNSI